MGEAPDTPGGVACTGQAGWRATEAYSYVTPPDPTWNAEQTEQHMSFYNVHALRIVSIHEAYPGHYVQFLWTKRVDSKVRRMLGSRSFSEGWGLYTEQMMLEAGYGGTGLEADKLKLNQLALYLQRLARYQVGLSLHTRGMTYEQAVRFFEEQAYMTRTNAEREGPPWHERSHLSGVRARQEDDSGAAGGGQGALGQGLHPAALP